MAISIDVEDENWLVGEFASVHGGLWVTRAQSALELLDGPRSMIDEHLREACEDVVFHGIDNERGFSRWRGHGTVSLAARSPGVAARTGAGVLKEACSWGNHAEISG
jgi:hypothetical protein